MAVNKKDLAPLTYQKVRPDTMVCDYLHSKAANRALKKFPEWDVARNEPSAQLVGFKRQLYGVHLRLGDKRKEARKRRKDVNIQWQDLEEKEKALRDNFIKFNRFVKENQEKRERAERKITEELDLIHRRDWDITELQKQYEYMYDIRTNMEKNIKNHKLYEEFLLHVTKICPTFRVVDDIIDRYETLVEAKKALSERQERDLSALEEARNEMFRVTEEKTLKILGLTNVMAELQTRYEVARSKALQWELMVSNVRNTSVEKLSELHEIRQCCWSIYLQMCKRKEVEPEIEQGDIEKQLLFIKQTMMELRKIARIAHKRATKESLEFKH